MSGHKPRGGGHLYTSHRDDTHLGATSPNEPHLGLLAGPGEVIAIPKGAHLFFIENPRRADTITEMLLEKVVYEDHVLKEIRLVAYTRNAKSTRRLVLTAAWLGEYKNALEGAAMNPQDTLAKTEEPFVNPITGKKG